MASSSSDGPSHPPAQPTWTASESRPASRVVQLHVKSMFALITLSVFTLPSFSILHLAHCMRSRGGHQP